MKTIRIGVYLCHCGVNIAATVNVKDVVEFAAKLPCVVIARDYQYMCSDPGQELIKSDIRELGLTRVVVASCSPRMHEPTFRNACEDAGLNPYCFEMANLREQCAWVHLDTNKATEKAKDLVASAVSKAALLEPLERKKVGVVPRALVIGGGVVGIYTARIKDLKHISWRESLPLEGIWLKTISCFLPSIALHAFLRRRWWKPNDTRTFICSRTRK
jgi:heterodisulfide reductase subunit A